MWQAAPLNTPQSRLGLLVEPLLADELVPASSFQTILEDIGSEYGFVDWGPEFTHMHATSLPHLTNPSRAFGLGGLDGDHIVNRSAAAYLPTRSAQRYLDAERLHLVADAPRFFYPAWVVWREDPNPELLSVARST